MIVPCPVCGQHGGILYGVYHVPCYDMMQRLDEDVVRMQLSDEVDGVATMFEEAAAAVRRIELTGDNITDLAALTTAIAAARHMSGLRMLNTHQHRAALVARRALMN